MPYVGSTPTFGAMKLTLEVKPAFIIKTLNKNNVRIIKGGAIDYPRTIYVEGDEKDLEKLKSEIGAMYNFVE